MVHTRETNRQISNIYGTVKAYCTRVGEGPFPTETEGETGDTLRYVRVSAKESNGRCALLSTAVLGLLVSGRSTMK